MIRILRGLKRKYDRNKLRKKLRWVFSLEDLLEFAKTQGDKYKSFIEYMENDDNYLNNPRISKIETFENLLPIMDGYLLGKSILELGPGFGAFIDFARLNGAKIVQGVDYDPFIVRLSMIRKSHVWELDYYHQDAFDDLLFYEMEYDLIFSRGSINMDRWERMMVEKKIWEIDFDVWLTRLKNLSAPNGQIILSPTYDIGDGDYHCGNAEARKGGSFAKKLFEHGFVLLPDIEGFTDPDYFPVTFCYRNND